jgi:multidrug resistance efflux pump
VSGSSNDDGGPPADAEVPQSRPDADPVRRLTTAVFVLLLLLFAWYVAADRFAPWTDQARVHAYVVPIAPKIPGRVIAVNVTENQIVAAGDLLARIDPRDYELAVAQAEAALELAGRDAGASTEEVSVAQARLAEARTQLRFVEQQAGRYLELARKGTVSRADADRAEAELDAAASRVESASAELERAKEKMGAKGNENAKVRDAIAALEQARINVAETQITAPGNGGITNLTLDVGRYASAGEPLMTFVSFTDVWVQANLKENSIGHVEPGNRVDIVLDSAPGRVFPGEVVSKGFAVDQPSSGEAGQAITISTTSGWLRDAQRFPVRIRFTDDSVRGYRRAGGQADVQIYTGDHALLNALGWLWIRLLSWLSYVY